MEMIKSAIFSECKKYRYQLIRQWDENGKMAMCIGLNPSTASELKDDATIHILMKALSSLGFGGFYMLNLYSWIATKPDLLFESPDPIGLTNEWLQTTAYQSQEIIFCWGSWKRISIREKHIKQMFPSAKCFGRNADGSPFHPRALTYIKDGIKNVTLIPYDKATIINC